MMTQMQIIQMPTSNNVNMYVINFEKPKDPKLKFLSITNCPDCHL